MKVHSKLDSNFNSGNEPKGRRAKSPPEESGILGMNTVVLQITTGIVDIWTYEKFHWSQLSINRSKFPKVF